MHRFEGMIASVFNKHLIGEFTERSAANHVQSGHVSGFKRFLIVRHAAVSINTDSGSLEQFGLWSISGQDKGEIGWDFKASIRALRRGRTQYLMLERKSGPRCNKVTFTP
jgi:hypothetical protein